MSATRPASRVASRVASYGGSVGRYGTATTEAWFVPMEGDGTATVGPNMTLAGTPTFYTPGIVGTSYVTLNGTSQNGVAASAFTLRQQVSVAMWLKTADTAAAIFETLGTASLKWELSGTDFVITVSGATGDLVHTLAGGLVNDDTWRHVAVTTDRNNESVRMWLDGIEQTLAKGTDTLTGVDASEDFQPRVGGSAATGWLAGSIDDLRVYNKIQSESDIIDLIKSAGVQQTPTGGLQWSPDSHVILLPR